MKLVLFISVLMISLSTFASNVPGELYYTLPNGELVNRSVTLTVPARGQGEVTLSGEKFNWSTTNFWSENINGENIFYAVFQTSFMNFKSTIAFKGTYLKGDNKIIYYGSMYKKKGHHEVNNDISDFKFSGGFNFNFDR